MSKRPVIGITTYAQEASWGVWHLPAALIPLDYVDAVERAGGRPVLIPPSEQGVTETLETLDGIVFSGGADIDPSLYGAEPHPQTDTPQARRDAGELALLEAALERDMPTLAICRGFQLLNVVRGGDLVQHLPEEVGSDEHKRLPGVFAEHSVEVKDGTRLASMVGPPLPGDVAPSPGNRAVGGRARRGCLGGGRDARGCGGPDTAVPGRRAMASGGTGGCRALREPGPGGAGVPGFRGKKLTLGASRETGDHVYWTLGVIYIVLSIVFIADVLRNRALSAGRKALWIAALLLVPVLAWLLYGIWRMRQSRGL